jgi:anaerobic ribonucleoside-triphosphate reductase
MTDKRRIPCQVYSRIVGYYAPLQSWNAGKKQEYKERVEYRVRPRKGSNDGSD